VVVLSCWLFVFELLCVIWMFVVMVCLLGSMV